MSYALLRKLLFMLPAEIAHAITLKGLTITPRICFTAIPTLPCKVMGINFPNPIGLAAGLDKNGDYIDSLAKLGFGFIEIGTVTPKPQTGNPKPRLFRLTEQEALINRMGFNNKGVDYMITRLQKNRYQGVLGINIGKNLTTPIEHALDDYQFCLKKLYPYADYITVNISSPNTPNLRALQFGKPLEQLISSLKQTQQQLQQQHQRYVPLVIKIAPDLTEQNITQIANTLITHEIDGVIATNTSNARHGIEHLPLAQQQGGLSGRPLMQQSTQIIKLLHSALGNSLAIIATGGIMNGANAKTKIKAGASLIQVYTGLIYQGPYLVRNIAHALDPLQKQ